MTEPALRALVLTEDSAKDADEIIRALLRQMFRQIVAVKPDGRRVEFTPVGAEAREASKGTNWQNPRHKHIVRLRRQIATHLAGGGFVFFHFDGDEVWARRAKSKNVRLFGRQIRARVELLVAQNAPRDGVAAAMSRLHAIVPFYSIEAWLFQNERVGLKVATCAADVERFEAWAADRTLLDEVDKPKVTVSFEGKFNAAFVERYPMKAVVDAERSLAATVWALKDDEALRAALEASVSW